MKNTNRTIAMIAGCVILVGAGCVFAQDWPQWRGPNRDGKVSGFAAPEKWTDAARHEKFGAVLDAGSVILALSSGSELIAFKPDDKGYFEVARYKVAETPIYAHPVISGNRVFVKDQESVAMWIVE